MFILSFLFFPRLSYGPETSYFCLIDIHLLATIDRLWDLDKIKCPDSFSYSRPCSIKKEPMLTEYHFHNMYPKTHNVHHELHAFPWIRYQDS